MAALISWTFLLILLYLKYSFAYKILGVFPHFGRSHFLVFEPLMKELANRGHEVVVISRYPQKKSVKNYVDVDITDSVPLLDNKMPLFVFDTIPVPLHVDMTALNRFLGAIEEALKTENFQNFMKTEQKFDLLITECFNTRLFYALAYKFQIPLVTLSSSPLLPWVMYDVANPQNPSYVPTAMSRQSDKMTFIEKLENIFVLSACLLYDALVLNPKSEELKEKYFGPGLPPLRDIAKNTSLVLVNTHFAYHDSRPLIPSVIPVGGLFIKPSEPLPKDIEKFINESKHGVVYFCMGSLLRGETFPEEKRNAFLYAFSKIPQRVLWKWEGDVLPGKPDNVMIAKWMPQRDILAHPNIKLFISHGGLLGTSEAVYEGVPILGIPIFGDQRSNIKAIEANGAGELLDYNEISNEIVLEKIQRLTTDPKYKENAKQLSERYKDRPMSPLDTAVYWTEYVIRHKGAPHLKTAAVNMPLYQYLLLDVIAFLIFVFVSAILILYYSVKIIVKIVCNLLCGKKSSSKPTKKEKRS